MYSKYIRWHKPCALAVASASTQSLEYQITEAKKVIGIIRNNPQKNEG